MKFLFYLSLMLIGPTFLMAQQDSLGSKQAPVGMTVEQFNLRLKTATKPLLVSFTADWCTVCKKQKPVIDQLLSELKGQVELLVIDMDCNPLLSAYFEIDGLPETILYKDGYIIWGRVGFQERTEILQPISPYISKK